MRQDEELWMKKVKESLRDYSESPSTDGWSKLEQELNPIAEKRILPYARWIAVAAVLAVAVSGVSLFFMHTPTDGGTQHIPMVASIPDDMPKLHTSEQPSSSKVPSHTMVNVTPARSSYLSMAMSPGGTRTMQEKEEVIAAKEILDTSVMVIGEEDIISKDKVTENSEKEHITADSSVEERRPIRPSSKDKLHIPVTAKNERNTRGNWAVAASVSNVASATSTQNRDFMISASNPSYLQNDGLLGMATIEGGDALVFEDGVPYLKHRTTVSEMKHKQPISVGLTVRKGLGNGFSVESGLVYTMLSSDGKVVDNPGKKIEQKMHYIGVPVRGNWDFIDSKRFTAYVSTGAMVEKCVYGKIGPDKHTVDELQFSITGGVGAQVNVSDRVGVYVEPGVSYFFDDGSDVETIRKENKVNFNLQAGIRLTY